MQMIPTPVDHATDAVDAVDAIEWLVRNIPESDGKVGNPGFWAQPGNRRQIQ